MKTVQFLFWFLTILTVPSLCYDFDESFSQIKTKTEPSIQSETVLDLIRRIIPKRANEFLVEIDPSLNRNGKEIFKINSIDNNKIKILATTGVTAATGFNYYLKYYLKSHISWEFDRINLPQTLPEVNMTISMNDKFRYYQNVCTTSYSFVWWDWAQWEKHIDWMALNSFNFVLAFNGQEAIWERVYKKLKLNRSEIDEHFAGPAFLSWQRMGNLRSFAGPLSPQWHQRSLILQKQILTRMRNFGMIPILPAFSGYVPKSLKRVFPDSNMSPMEWNKFNESYQAYLLDPFDPQFQTVGNLFMDELMGEFGTDHVYSSDTFNEVKPPSGNLSYIKKAGEAVFDAMRVKDPEAVWVMQNWLFVHSFLFWTPDRVRALLDSVPVGKMIILDLQSEQFPQYERFQNYYGHPYIWCMLHDFGGTLGMFGSSDIINKRPFDVRSKKGSSMVGTGLTPEGIFQNYIIYELMSEMAFREKPVNLDEWLKQYLTRRYGKLESNSLQSWSILMSTVYSFPGTQRVRGKYTITISPNTKFVSKYWYNHCDIYRSWNHLMQASDTFKTNKGFQHDLVDLTRQVLQHISDNYYQQILLLYKRKDKKYFNASVEGFLSIFDDLDLILNTNENFLLGFWLNSAKNCSNNSKDKLLYEYNARNQITLWGPNGEIKDYATKQWAGLVKDYYKKRWEYFLNEMEKSLANGKNFNEGVVRKVIFEKIEKPFSFDDKEYSDRPQGDTIEIAKGIHEKWWSKINCDNL